MLALAFIGAYLISRRYARLFLPMEILNIEETNELERCEVVIKQGLDTFVEVGQALLTIRDKRLYRASFRTFEEYCGERWGMGRRYTNQIIAAAEVVTNLGAMAPILPQTERQTRPLATLAPDLQREAWNEVVQKSEATGQPITATAVKTVADTYKQAREQYRDMKQEERRVQLEQKTAVQTIPIDQQERITALENGQTVVLNMNKDFHLLKFAQDRGLYIRCDRFSDWGNPFLMGVDGDRDEVCNNFERHYLPHKKGLQARIFELKGKALGCHCFPERCHCETLKTLADEA